MDESKPEEGKQYSLLKLAQTGSWAESEVPEDDQVEWGRKTESPTRIAEGTIELVSMDTDKTNDQLEQESYFQVGAIWHTSWGYDQTNVEFFEVVRESESSVWLRRITSAADGDSRVVPVPGQYTTDVHLRGNQTEWDSEKREFVPAKKYTRDMKRGYSEKVCRKQGYGDGATYRVHVRIDKVRTAWPYEGGGQYETPFGMGH